ncbi:sensor domain-containing diguanylate cyclase [Aquincola tertiaricarbonis]|uniref:Sensor domain-containing diguanylate cyclase n=1 Tax=Aquincola tertiaricarbonis TaxID=391953 RepID=A0ABY4S4V6_AQUTE|nr:diguanylate cyclase [Aquincola tertiaricarbonis]URI06912.1 sensor domain-containing diguanylate cyclase [Aquincola tertiaricarbonis]
MPWPVLLRRFPLLLCCLVLVVGLGRASPALAAPGKSATGPVQVDDRSRITLWPAVTLRHDAEHNLPLEEVMAAPGLFQKPVGTPANLGRMPDTLWLRIPLQVAGTAPVQRVFGIDYPPLDRVDVYLVAGGQVLSHVRMGSSLEHELRPLRSRTLAAPLDLPPGASELYVRVWARSSMVLPMTLRTPEAFAEHEARGQLLQGLLAGLAVAMLMYSIAHGVALRDGMFGYYALLLAGNMVFFMSYFGILAQHVWPHAPQLAQEISPQAVLIAVFGGSAFMSRALAVGEVSRWAARLLQLLGWIALAGLAAYHLGWMDFRAVQGLATLMGLLPTCIALPIAVLRARRGDRTATVMVLGWSVFLVGTAALVGTILGKLQPTFWALHLYPLATMCEMAVWMVVLALRVQAIHRHAERARVETHRLRDLAHTDALTGLPNRRGLHDRMLPALAESTPDQLLAVYLLDLDGFKPVNDHYGHDVGDALLVAVGQRLQAELRTTDVVARVGGDEFVVLAAGLVDAEAAHALSQKLLQAFDAPFMAAGHTCQVGLTIGYALAPLDGSDADELIKRADAAMYAGKQAGRRRAQRGGRMMAAA